MNIKRYNLALPTVLYDELEAAANARSTTVVALLRKFIKLGLIALKAEQEGHQFIIREGDSEREIVFY